MVQLLTHGFNPAYRTDFLACLLSPVADRVALPAVQAASAAKCLRPHLHPSQQRASDVVGRGGGTWRGGHSRSRRRLEICCWHMAAAAASGAGQGGHSEERRAKTQLGTWERCAGPPYLTHQTGQLGFLFQTFPPFPSSAWVWISTVAHPQLLHSVILWTTLLSTAVVQTPVHGKGLGLPSPVSLANAALSDDYEKPPVSTSHGCFRSSKTKNSESQDIFLSGLAI